MYISSPFFVSVLRRSCIGIYHNHKKKNGVSWKAAKSNVVRSEGFFTRPKQWGQPSQVLAEDFCRNFVEWVVTTPNTYWGLSAVKVSEAVSLIITLVLPQRKCSTSHPPLSTSLHHGGLWGTGWHCSIFKDEWWLSGYRSRWSGNPSRLHKGPGHSRESCIREQGIFRVMTQVDLMKD